MTQTRRDLETIAARFRTLHAAFLRTASTRSLLAGFDALDAAIESALDNAHSPAALADTAQCPRCLDRSALRVDVEACGVCSECFAASRPDRSAAL